MMRCRLLISSAQSSSADYFPPVRRAPKSLFFPLNFGIRYHLSVCGLFHESDVREIQYRICKDALTSRKILSEKVNKKCTSERAAREWYYLKVAGIIFQNTSPITTRRRCHRRRKENGMRERKMNEREKERTPFLKVNESAWKREMGEMILLIASFRIVSFFTKLFPHKSIQQLMKNGLSVCRTHWCRFICLHFFNNNAVCSEIETITFHFLSKSKF